MIAAFIYLLVISLAFGYSAWKLLDLDEESQSDRRDQFGNDLTRVVMYIATGLIVFVQASVVLGFVGMASWQSYLALALLLLGLSYKKLGSWPYIKVPKIDRNWIMITVLFAIHFYIYATGALSYPWLEDDDPWGHAAAVKYVASFNSYLQPAHLPMHYLAPYPPFFDVLLGVLHQIDGSSMQLTLKVFNAFLVSLAIPFFYAWIKSSKKFGERTALWATFAIAILPSFMSHFIWSQTLSVILVFPSLYFIDKAMDSVRANGNSKISQNMIAACAFSTATVLITQPSSAVMFLGLLGAYLASIVIYEIVRSLQAENGKITPEKILGSGQVRSLCVLIALSLLLALAEFWVPMFVLYPADAILEKLSLSASILTEKYGDTGGGLVYGLNDFLIAPLSSKMDQPVGFGQIISVLVIVGILSCISTVLNRDKSGDEQENILYSLFVLITFIYSFVGVEGNLLPIKLVPHRFWVFLAIPTALLAGIGAVVLLNRLEKRNDGTVSIAKVVIVIGLLMTSAYPKYTVETSQWPPGVSWASYDQITAYANLKSLPPNTNIFSFCMHDQFIVGFDKGGYPWDKAVQDYKDIAVKDSVDGNYKFLKEHQYQYAIIDQSCLKNNGNDALNVKATALAGDGRFELQNSLSNQVAIVLKVK